MHWRARVGVENVGSRARWCAAAWRCGWFGGLAGGALDRAQAHVTRLHGAARHVARLHGAARQVWHHTPGLATEQSGAGRSSHAEHSVEVVTAPVLMCRLAGRGPLAAVGYGPWTVPGGGTSSHAIEIERPVDRHSFEHMPVRMGIARSPSLEPVQRRLEGRRDRPATRVIRISDPAGRGWDLFGTGDYAIDWTVVSPATIAWVQTLAIAIGHVAGVAAAHDVAISRYDHRLAVRSQYPMLAVMILYTVLGLFLLLGA